MRLLQERAHQTLTVRVACPDHMSQAHETLVPLIKRVATLQLIL